eukprot:gene11913-2172_t
MALPALGAPPRAVQCDVFIAGGSTASLAAAIATVALLPRDPVPYDASCGLHLCNACGGQPSGPVLTAHRTISHRRKRGPRLPDPSTMPASWGSFMAAVPGNPGACSVSIKCYRPNWLVKFWVRPKLASLPNLKRTPQPPLPGCFDAACPGSSTCKRSAYAPACAPTDTRMLGTHHTRVCPNGAPVRTCHPACGKVDPRLEWQARLSDDLPDWYSPEDSPRFTKQLLQFSAKVFIDASELGDILMTSGVPARQGVETPQESSPTCNSTCGQAATFTYYTTRLPAPAPPPDVPDGGDEGLPFGNWTQVPLAPPQVPSPLACLASGNLSDPGLRTPGPCPDPGNTVTPTATCPATPQADWLHTWTWRRALCACNTSLLAVNAGDVTQQNLYNDYRLAHSPAPAGPSICSALGGGQEAQAAVAPAVVPRQPALRVPPCAATPLALHIRNGYIFQDVDLARRSVNSTAGWVGGLNLFQLRRAEDRAYGACWATRNQSHLAGADPATITLDFATSGTLHGLSKFPYLRGTRRSVGLDGFLLTYPALDGDVPAGEPPPANGSTGSAGYRFRDTPHLNAAMQCIHGCTLPNYTETHITRPYYVPFRALTNAQAGNLLVAGKTIAETFHANGATRLHPSEWTTGNAAGAAAVLMVRNGWDSAAVLRNVGQLQDFLRGGPLRTPLEWQGLPPPPAAAAGFVCQLDRCFTVPQDSHYPHLASSCNDLPCTSILKTVDWLANKAYWKLSADEKTIIATQDTVLKKSEVNSGILPSDQLHHVT